MIDMLLSRRIDDTFRGHRSALWLFGLVVAVKSVQSVGVIANGDVTAVAADGIPLDTFSPAAARAVVALCARARALVRRSPLIERGIAPPGAPPRRLAD